jgi:hypothetical protein
MSEKRYDDLRIEGRRWFQKSYGNTYHSVRIFKGNKRLVTISGVYGYGDCFMQTAFEWLATNGYPEFSERHENGSPVVWMTEYREQGGAYSVQDVSRQKDL